MPRPTSLPGLPADYTSKFFAGDTVRPVGGNDKQIARVLRCWADEEGEPPIEPGRRRNPLDRSLLRGEVGVSNALTGELSIDPESTYTLINREFLRGDLVKRSLTEADSAVVIETMTKVKLESLFHVGRRLHEWVPWKLLGSNLALEQRDRVVYDDWVGTVEEVLEDGLVRPQFGPMYKISGTGGMLEVNRVVAESNPNPSGGAMFMLPPHANPEVDVICDVQPAVVLISWNALNQTLPIAEQNKPEPPKIWSGDDIKKLTHFDMSRWSTPQLRTQVRFVSEQDEHRYATTLGVGIETRSIPGMGHIKSSYTVVGIETTLRLRWQDGSENTETSLNVVPYRNVDDYESWPGEHILWKGDAGEKRFAVLQSFDPRERVASLRFSDDNSIDTVPVLELDPGGQGRPAYGAPIGMQVLLTNDNGAEFPQVPPLGRIETPHDHINAQGELAAIAEQRGRSLQLVTTGSTQSSVAPEGDQSKVDWWGEVIDHKLDGIIVVRLANGQIVEKTPKQLHILNDPFGVDFDGHDHDHDHDHEHDHHHGIADEFAQMFGYQPFDSDARMDLGDEWEDDDERISVIEGEGRGETGHVDGGGDGWETVSEDGNGQAGRGWADDDAMEVDNESEADAEEVCDLVNGDGEPNARATRPTQPTQASSTANDASNVNMEDAIAAASNPKFMAVIGHANAEAGPSSAPYNGTAMNGQEEDGWERFELLEEAPAEHKYYEQPKGTGSKAYMSRIRKEHKALVSSLPENILVRAYEDRLDLLRVLIFGPEGTPYSDAPFVFDVHLDPAKFPNEPPSVYFHSHTNGHGRCNPNLYEDGKVCLSILGTWQGDKSESWSSQKSSLLQVFVSISGLVLVRSPYHCEPAFAKLEGTREGKVNSRHYSEKAYVLSRSFVRTALTRPPASFEAEMKHFYFTRGHLRRVISHAKSLMDKTEANADGSAEEDEENAEMWNADAVGSLTKGAVISLKRTITALEKLMEEHEAASA